MTEMEDVKHEELQNLTEAKVEVEVEDMDDKEKVDTSEVLDVQTDDIIEDTCKGDDITAKLIKKEQECDEYLDLLKRTKADFDNFRKRTLKEKESLYNDGFVDGIKQILPVIDSLERAIGFNTSENDSLLEGVEMVLKMFYDILSKNEIVEIPAEGEKFDPHYHNAVMHIEDKNYEDNVVIEVLQKGYKFKEKILRYSMVKVAN